MNKFDGLTSEEGWANCQGIGKRPLWYELHDPEESVFRVWILELRHAYHHRYIGIYVLSFIVLIVPFGLSQNVDIAPILSAIFLFYGNKRAKQQNSIFIHYVLVDVSIHSTVIVSTGTILIVCISITKSHTPVIVSACQLGGLIRTFYLDEKIYDKKADVVSLAENCWVVDGLDLLQYT